jgi:hypothetical protein
MATTSTTAGTANTTATPQPLQPIPRDQIGENTNWRNWFNNLAQNGSIITTRLNYNSLTTDSAGNLYAGASNLAAGIPYFVNTAQLADAAVSAAKLGALSVNTANINPGAVTQALIASGAVGYQQFQTGLTPVSIVASLPSLPNTNYPLNSVVSLTTDGKLYRNVSGVWTAAVNGADITVNTIPAVALVNNSITATQIAPVTITAAQIANNTITSGQIAAYTITAGQIAANTITAGQIAANTITASQIQAGTITTNQIASNTILANNIAANTITAGQIAANTITAGQIQASTITSTQIAANTITASNILANTITASQIAAGTITATQIASNTIVAGNIATGTITAASGILANASVGTLTIAGQAVTIPVSAFSASGGLYNGTTPYTTISATITSTGAPIAITGGCTAYVNYTTNPDYYMSITRVSGSVPTSGGTQLWTGLLNGSVTTANYPTIGDTPGAGTWTYEVQVWIVSGSGDAIIYSNSSLLLLETKR